MHLLKSLALTAGVLLVFVLILFGLIVPDTAGIAIDPGFILGTIRSALLPLRADVIQLPTGFAASVYADGLKNPTALAAGPNGKLYVAQLSGEIVVLDGKSARTYISGFTAPLGLAWRGDELYVASRNTISVIAPDGRTRQIVDGLPAARHQTDQVAFGRDGRLYIGQGSRSDHGELVGIDALEASVLVANADGSGLRVFARGLRNPYGIAFHPETGELFATDNGKDVPGVGVPDELNLVTDGGNYGWPDCYGQGKGSNCAGTIPPLAEFEEHASADGLTFYAGGSFPAEYRNNAFVALYGSNSGDPLIGRRIERVVLDKSTGGYRATVTTFASGFRNPLAVAVGADGALYVADFGAGKVYRISWAG